MCFLIRLLGWFLIGAAVLVASMEMSMSLSTGDYASLATRDIWTLFVGVPPPFEESLSNWQEAASILAKVVILFTHMGAVAMEIPAWTMVGLLGVFLVFTSRLYRLNQTGHYRRLFR